jgi:tRNA A-37 threonylcarbamoyl transferase component Bud32
MAGEVLAGRYELEELVGTGGMSSVYRAHDQLLDRKVALKILHEHYGTDDTYVARFRHEARAVAALSHPNIVTVIDRGDQDGRQFIVFEYVEGENLKQLVERGPVPVVTALEVALQVGRGLSFAHQHGLIHRDVKPQNVLLNGNGEAKVTDFGIARSLSVQHGMTQTGTVLGTSDYIAPEQAQGRHVDEQSDVYSLGVVLFELLTGRVPFPGENFVAIAMRHINEPPPSVRELRPDVSPRLDAVVQRAMAKEPGDRFPTMRAFCEELDACLAEARGGAEGTYVLPPQAAVRRHRRTSAWPLLVLLAALLAIGGVVAFLLLHGNGTSGGGTPAVSGGGTIALSGIGAYDPPPGDGREHDDAAHFATDHDGSTYWKTESYHDAPSLNKPGVGLVLDAGQGLTLHRLRIATSTPGFTAVIKGGDSPTDFTAELSPSETVQDGTEFRLSGGTYRYYLIWITRLGQGYDDARINEVGAS